MEGGVTETPTAPYRQLVGRRFPSICTSDSGSPFSRAASQHDLAVPKTAASVEHAFHGKSLGAPFPSHDLAVLKPAIMESTNKIIGSGSPSSASGALQALLLLRHCVRSNLSVQVPCAACIHLSMMGMASDQCPFDGS